MSKINLEVDCTKRCKSRSHGQALTSAITKRSVTDESLASFIKATCANFSKAFDFEVSMFIVRFLNYVCLPALLHCSSALFNFEWYTY